MRVDRQHSNPRARPWRAVVSAILLTVVALTLSACGSDGSTGPSAPVPDIVGSYEGDWTYILAYAPPGGDQDLFCPGTLLVASQSPNGTFTGTWSQLPTSDDCNEASGTLSGIVAPGGDITVVSLSSDGGGSGSTLEEVTGGECVATRFDDGYRGSADGSSFEISYAISGECGPGRAVSWVTAFAGVSVPEPAAEAPWNQAPGPAGASTSEGLVPGVTTPYTRASSVARRGSESAFRDGG